MQLASRDVIPDVSIIEILPFINMNPSDTSTIYSALCFAQEQCRKQGIPLCPVTSDQPLYIEAVNIVAASDDLGNVFIRLEEFHLFMSFLGSVGSIMSGSGLEKQWESVYAKGSIPQTMNGHAYSQAL